MKKSDKNIYNQIDLLKTEIANLKFLNDQDIASLSLCFKEIFENLMVKTEKKGDKYSSGVKFDCVINLIKPATLYAKKKDYEAFGVSIAFIQARLISILNRAEDGVQIIERMQKKMDKLGL